MKMFAAWGSLAGILLYLEVIYHISCFGFVRCNPIYTLLLLIAWSSIETLLVSVVKGRWKNVLYYFFLWFAAIWTCVQVVYLRIFKQPLLWEAAFRGGGDALTNYWREAMDGIIGALPILIAVLMPVVVITVVLQVKKMQLPSVSRKFVWCMVATFGIGIVGCVTTLQVGKYTQQDYFEDYSEFFDPMTVAETMGVWPLLERDTVLSVERMAENAWKMLVQQVILTHGGDYREVMGQIPETTPSGQESPSAEFLESDVTDGDSSLDKATENNGGERVQNAGSQEKGSPKAGVVGAESGSVGNMKDVQTGKDSIGNTESLQAEPQVPGFSINMETLRGLADNDKQKWLADYIESLTPAGTNEYTGIFEGYNLIYLTAEGFSTHAVREELTPTLYRLINSGFVFNNYYVPLWQTSTSDGEYINCTGLIPDGQFSMKKSAKNDMEFTLPKFFKTEGVTSYAYHNNSLSYYDRYLTHPNLGYDFKACKLGNLSSAEWGGQIFSMEHPDEWPASDLEMMQGTIPEYINKDRFHVYYLTVSGHMNYNFGGNAMSSKNREAVAGLEMSENARAYIGCNIELDKALEYLLQELEAAGKLENTVICLSADHYPYAMTSEQYEELAGKSLSRNMDLYRNSIILWNAGMEAEPVVIDKACGSMDIIPTLLNLFGFSYDSRMYAGRDMLSEEEGMVIFNDRSFVTDGVIYKRKTKETIWLKDAEGNDIIPDEAKEAYLEAKKQAVKERYQFSAYVLQENYYADVVQAVEEYYE